MSHSHVHPVTAEAAQAVFEAAGEQWTEIRAAVYDAVVHADGPQSAYEIADRMSGNLGRRIAPNTVYRILDLFLAHNIVNRIESRNAYVACVHPDAREDCIFLVCERCGATAHVDDVETGARVRQLSAGAGFQPKRLVLESHGLCAACQG